MSKKDLLQQSLPALVLRGLRYLAETGAAVDSGSAERCCSSLREPCVRQERLRRGSTAGRGQTSGSRGRWPA